MLLYAEKGRLNGGVQSLLRRTGRGLHAGGNGRGRIYLSAYVLETYLSDTADEATARYARHIFWHELFHCLTRLAYGMDGPRGVGYPNPEIIEGIYKILKGGSN